MALGASLARRSSITESFETLGRRHGAVYRAEDTHLASDVALKSLPEVLARNRNLVVSLPRKAHSALALKHPNLSAAHDIPVLKNPQADYANLGE